MAIILPITKEEMRSKIRRKLGEPMVRVELDDSQIDDAIDDSVMRFIKDATGQATQETFFTYQISTGVARYKMPAAVTEIIDYDDASRGSSFGSGGINTLFSLDNYMYQQGMLDPIVMMGSGGGGGASLVSYKIAMDFLETMKAMFPPKFRWKYHHKENELEIVPVPYISGNGTSFVLLRATVIEGTDLDATEKDFSYFFGKEWVFLYALARAKQTLGMVRRKFGSFQSIGNTGISLDGDSLMSEGTQEIAQLEDRLHKEESWTGMGISTGFVL